MSVQPVYSEFTSTDGEHKIVVTHWAPKGTPVGIVQLVHGMQEHMGRYQEFAEFLTENNYLVFGHDHIGHGRSAMNWGTYGYFGKEKGAKTLLKDTVFLTEDLAFTYPDLPLFLLGHSMGSLIGRLAVVHVPYFYHGFICMGTIGSHFGFWLLRALSEGVCLVRGKERSSRLPNKMMDALSFHGLAKNEQYETWATHDIEKAASIANDPHGNFLFTNQGYSDLLDLAIAANREGWYQRLDMDLPLFFVSGKEDPVGGYGKDILQIVQKLKKDEHSDARYKIYDGMRHEILNEIDREEVYYDLLIWLDEHR